MVKVVAGPFAFCVVSAHAPHSGRPLAEITTWWQDLTALIESLAPAGVPVVGFLDANGAGNLPGPLDHPATKAAASLGGLLGQKKLLIGGVRGVTGCYGFQMLTAKI